MDYQTEDDPGLSLISPVVGYPDTLLYSADVQPLRNMSGGQQYEYYENMSGGQQYEYYENMSGGQQSGVFQFSLIPLRCEEI